VHFIESISKWVVNNKILGAIIFLIPLITGIYALIRKLGGSIRRVSNMRHPIEVIYSSNNIYDSGTTGSLSAGNLIKVRFYLSVNLYKKISSNIIVNFSDIKIYPNREIKGTKFTVNPYAYREKNTSTSSTISSLSIRDTNTIIYFFAKICFQEKVNLTTLEDYKTIPVSLYFNVSISNYFDNKPFEVPMKNFFRDFIKEFKK